MIRPSFPSTVPAVRRDAGTSFVEVLIAVVLMGTVILVIIGGLLAVIRASSSSDEQARVEAALGNAVEELSAAQWQQCPISGYETIVAAAVESTGGPGYGSRIGSVEFWVRNAADVDNLESGSWQSSDPGATQPNCHDENAELDPRESLQKMTIEVWSPGAEHVRQVEVVKSIVTDLNGSSPVETP